MKLIIVESPTKSKTIFRLLKIPTIATKGHILDLPPKGFGLYIDDNSIQGKYIFLPFKKRLIEKINQIAKNCDEIYIGTDPDREGEMIAYHIFQNLNHNRKFRIYFHEITKQSLLKAISQKTSINLNLVQAQKARRFLDRIIGYSLSPLLWQQFKNRNLSAGRVQSAALYLIVKREREIKNFIKEKYYLLKVILMTELGKREVWLIDEKNELKKLRDQEKLTYLERIRKAKHLYLDKETEIIKTLSAPLALDTEMLQRLAFEKLKFAPQKTMFLAQKLFELGFITYHRTDSHFINKNFSDKVKDFITKNYGEEYFQYPRQIKSKLSFEAHEAIRPTSLNSPKLNGDFLKLYELIFFQTILAHFSPAKIKERHFFFFNDDLRFEGKEISILFDGFLKLKPVDIETEKWPELKRGDKLSIKSYQFIEKETQPPPRFTESSLIKTLKKLGIGRPSTYVPILETLKKRKYVKKINQSLQPTELGEEIIKFLESRKEEILNLDFTKNTEEKLDLIAQGKENADEFLKIFWSKYVQKS